MIHSRLLATAVLLAGLMLFAGCGVQQIDESGQRDERLRPVTCIGVLPAIPMMDPGDGRTEMEEKSLIKGTEVLNRLLREELGGRSDIRFVDRDQVAGIQLDGSENALELARLVGRDINCNVMLQSYMWRYSERMGGKYTVEEPAAVAFDLKLIGIEQGTVL